MKRRGRMMKKRRRTGKIWVRDDMIRAVEKRRRSFMIDWRGRDETAWVWRTVKTRVRTLRVNVLWWLRPNVNLRTESLTLDDLNLDKLLNAST